MKNHLIVSLLFLAGCKHIVQPDTQPKKVPFNDVPHYSQLQGNLSPFDTIKITDKDFRYCRDITDCMVVKGDCGWFNGINKHQQEKAKLALFKRYSVIDCLPNEDYVDYELSCERQLCRVNMIEPKHSN